MEFNILGVYQLAMLVYRFFRVRYDIAIEFGLLKHRDKDED